MAGAACVFFGAGVGALLRWGLSLALNGMFAPIPFGTLLANVAGGFLMGIALGAFDALAGLSPHLRLALITGFLGGLTTFSAFTAESLLLLQRSSYAWAAAHAGVHVLLSLLAAFAGLAAARWAFAGAG